MTLQGNSLCISKQKYRFVKQENTMSECGPQMKNGQETKTNFLLTS